MSKLGRIEFSPESETISSYLERMELFLVANDVANDKRAAVFFCQC